MMVVVVGVIMAAAAVILMGVRVGMARLMAVLVAAVTGALGILLAHRTHPLAFLGVCRSEHWRSPACVASSTDHCPA